MFVCLFVCLYVPPPGGGCFCKIYTSGNFLSFDRGNSYRILRWSYRISESRWSLILMDQFTPAIVQFLSKVPDSPVEVVACVALQFAFTKAAVPSRMLWEAILEGVYRLQPKRIGVYFYPTK
jgi:hypothetical protein